MLKFLPIILLSLCGCAHTQTVLPNHTAEHQHALQVATDKVEHLQECRERFMMCGVETGGMICGVNLTDDGQVDCLIAGEGALQEVQACMIKIKNEAYCKNVK